MMNISLVGRLTKQVELKKFPSEKGETIISNGTIAVKRKNTTREKENVKQHSLTFKHGGKMQARWQIIPLKDH